MSPLLSLLAAVVKAVGAVARYLDSRQLVQAGEDKAVLRALMENEKRVQLALDARRSIKSGLVHDNPFREHNNDQ